MAERQIGQLSFADELVNDAARANAPLQRVSELVDWSAIEALLSGLRSGSMGARAYPSLVLFKACCCSNGTGCRIRDLRKPW